MERKADTIKWVTQCLAGLLTMGFYAGLLAIAAFLLSVLVLGWM